MASDLPELDSVRRESGLALLQTLDKVGFGAIGAAWVQDADSSSWHYLLISPMIDSQGPLWVHERLLRVYRQLTLPAGITPLDIYVASPRELDMATLAAAYRVDGGMVELRDTTINHMHIDHMVIYRMQSFVRNGAGETARAFDRKVKALIAA